MNPAIKTAINIVGSQKKLGAACEVSQQAVYKWLHNKAKVSPEHVGSIVTATGGVVKAYQIRPDLSTHRKERSLNFHFTLFNNKQST
ncbi:TPA: helix-turn-helix domain-containing protein [Escherichia coli O25b:H4-ST131]|nr:helix-turn-helix domain-containing protein [Escherichia coli]HAI7738481.1 helix-turn-helix domain-containing protein [Escherichia coli O25b:H4-ST131]EKX3023692.1 helix-turn-helix domain-containing protein [Escherichia coli]EKX3071759.1 helix-turn-helix domain-containing protein [Escherichia coli]MBB0866946.1 helix-turn-helix domain-containing protein [Escherichia coli]